MNKEEAIYFAGLMQIYLNIPSFVCENIEKKLIDENYKEVIEFIINRTKELKEKQKDKKYQIEIAYETINKQQRVLDKIEEIPLKHINKANEELQIILRNNN